MFVWKFEPHFTTSPHILQQQRMRGRGQHSTGRLLSGSLALATCCAVSVCKQVAHVVCLSDSRNTLNLLHPQQLLLSYLKRDRPCARALVSASQLLTLKTPWCGIQLVAPGTCPVHRGLLCTLPAGLRLQLLS